MGSVTPEQLNVLLNTEQVIGSTYGVPPDIRRDWEKFPPANDHECKFLVTSWARNNGNPAWRGVTEGLTGYYIRVHKTSEEVLMTAHRSTGDPANPFGLMDALVCRLVKGKWVPDRAMSMSSECKVPYFSYSACKSILNAMEAWMAESTHKVKIEGEATWEV